MSVTARDHAWVGPAEFLGAILAHVVGVIEGATKSSPSSSTLGDFSSGASNSARAGSRWSGRRAASPHLAMDVHVRTDNDVSAIGCDTVSLATRDERDCSIRG